MAASMSVMCMAAMGHEKAADGDHSPAMSRSGEGTRLLPKQERRR